MTLVSYFSYQFQNNWNKEEINNPFELNKFNAKGGMPWPKTDATHYHKQLGLPDKVRAINRCLLLYDVVWLRSII